MHAEHQERLVAINILTNMVDGEPEVYFQPKSSFVVFKVHLYVFGKHAPYYLGLSFHKIPLSLFPNFIPLYAHEETPPFKSLLSQFLKCKYSVTCRHAIFVTKMCNSEYQDQCGEKSMKDDKHCNIGGKRNTSLVQSCSQTGICFICMTKIGSCSHCQKPL